MASKPFKKFTKNIIILLIRSVIWVYDIVTLPAYLILQRPWRYWFDPDKDVTIQLNPSDPTSPYTRSRSNPSSVYTQSETVDDMFRLAAKNYAEKKCFGYRKILEETTDVQSDGTIFKKVTHGDYNWITYKEADNRVQIITSSLLSIGIMPKNSVIIFSETRMEWMLTALACFRLNVPVVTLYSTLNEEGTAHGINEAGSKYLFTSANLLPKVLKLLPKLTYVTHIIYFEGFKKPNIEGIPSNVKTIIFEDFYNLGKDYITDIPIQGPSKEDDAIVMYTSGSTGNPKGVVLLHKHIMRDVEAVECMHIPFWKDGSYIAYLPLSHIFEFSVELLMLRYGNRIGYSSPFTLTDKSTAVKKGDVGDIKVLRPDVITAVPLVLDRMRKGIIESIEEKGEIAKDIFYNALKYKSFWYKLGFNTPVLDRLIFKKVQEAFGGRLHIIATGGAPLSKETLEFIRLTLNALVSMIFGQTESSGVAIVTDPEDRTMGHVGRPMKNVFIKLTDWQEGGYSVHDKPNPRGEIMIGGSNITKGYFKNDKLTKENYFDEDGIKWVRSGDIGEKLGNGKFRIIDRRKDLIKLQYGEYISLGKVESELKTSPLVDNICVIGDSYQDHLIALVLPNKDQLYKLASDLKIPNRKYKDLCQNPNVTKEITKILRSHGKRSNLLSREIPMNFKICSEEWTPDSGLVTAGMKIRRKTLEKFYKQWIENAYSTLKI